MDEDDIATGVKHATQILVDRDDDNVLDRINIRINIIIIVTIITEF